MMVVIYQCIFCLIIHPCIPSGSIPGGFNNMAFQQNIGTNIHLWSAIPNFPFSLQMLHIPLSSCSRFFSIFEVILSAGYKEKLKYTGKTQITQCFGISLIGLWSLSSHETYWDIISGAPFKTGFYFSCLL